MYIPFRLKLELEVLGWTRFLVCFRVLNLMSEQLYLVTSPHLTGSKATIDNFDWGVHEILQSTIW